MLARGLWAMLMAAAAVSCGSGLVPLPRALAKRVAQPAEASPLVLMQAARMLASVLILLWGTAVRWSEGNEALALPVETRARFAAQAKPAAVGSPGPAMWVGSVAMPAIA